MLQMKGWKEVEDLYKGTSRTGRSSLPDLMSLCHSTREHRFGFDFRTYIILKVGGHPSQSSLRQCSLNSRELELSNQPLTSSEYHHKGGSLDLSEVEQNSFFLERFSRMLKPRDMTHRVALPFGRSHPDKKMEERLSEGREHKENALAQE